MPDELPDLLDVEEPVVVPLELHVLDVVADRDGLVEDVSVLLDVEVPDEVVVVHIVHVESPEDVSLRDSIGVLL